METKRAPLWPIFMVGKTSTAAGRPQSDHSQPKYLSKADRKAKKADARRLRIRHAELVSSTDATSAAAGMDCTTELQIIKEVVAVDNFAPAERLVVAVTDDDSDKDEENESVSAGEKSAKPPATHAAPDSAILADVDNTCQSWL